MTEPRDTKDSKNPTTPLEPAFSCPWPSKEPSNPDPDDMGWQRQVLDGSSGKNRNFLISFLLFQWYLILIVLGVTDFDLFVPDNRISLPLLNLEIPLFSFFIVSPPLLLAFHFNLLFNLHEHGKLVADWCERYKEPPKLSPFLFNYLFKLKKAEKGFLLLPIVWSFLVFYIPLFTFVLVQWRFSDYHHQLMTSFHFVFVGLDFALVVLYRRIWDLPFLQSLVEQRDHATKWEQVKAWFKQERGIDHFFASPWLGPGELFKKAKLLAQNFPFGVLLISLSAGVNYQAFQWVLGDLWVQKYKIHRNGKGEIDGVDCSQQTDKHWLVLDLFCSEDLPLKKEPKGEPIEQEPSGFLPSREFLFSILVPVLDLHEQELVRKKPDDSLVARYTNDFKKDKLDVFLEFGQGYNLQGRDLQLANLQLANLLKVDFRGANLKKAELDEAQLQRANLGSAHLQGANLGRARMQGANLEGARMQVANLEGARMQGANLNWAELQGTNLNWAQLQGTNLNWAQLQGANLEGAQLQGANLNLAELQGAFVSYANFYKADFSPDQLQATYGQAVSEPEKENTTGEQSTPLPLGDPTAFLQARKNLLCWEEEFLPLAKNMLSGGFIGQNQKSPADQGLILKWIYQDPACRPRLQAIKNATPKSTFVWRGRKLESWLHLELEKPEYDFSPQ